MEARDLPMPGDATMLALVAIAFGCGVAGTEFCFHPEAEHFGISIPGGKTYRIEFEQYDALVARGWVQPDGDSLGVTEQGKWQADKWLRRKKVRLVA